MSVQTSVDLDPALAVAGMEADNGPKDVVTMTSLELIPYGNFVCRDEQLTSSDRACRLPNQATDITDNIAQMGIARAAFDVESQNDGLVPNYPSQSLVSVASSGRYWVKVDGAVSTGSAVFVRFQNKPTIITITYDADFDAGDNIIITVNGVAVTTAYNTSNAQTFTDIDTNLTAAFGGILQDVAVDAGANTVTVTSVLNTAITVTSNEPASSTAPPTVVTTQAGTPTTDRGLFRSDDDTATAAQWSEARWASDAVAGGYAILDIQQ